MFTKNNSFHCVCKYESKDNKKKSDKLHVDCTFIVGNMALVLGFKGCFDVFVFPPGVLFLTWKASNIYHETLKLTLFKG